MSTQFGVVCRSGDVRGNNVLYERANRVMIVVFDTTSVATIIHITFQDSAFSRCKQMADTLTQTVYSAEQVFNFGSVVSNPCKHLLACKFLIHGELSACMLEELRSLRCELL